MDESTVDLLCCPDDGSGLRLESRRRTATGVVEGRLVCSETGDEYPITDGIPNLLPPGIEPRETGMGEGQAFPARYWFTLVNPLRRLILSPGELVDRLDPDDDATVLEIGPGAGYFTPAIARAVPEGRVIALDFQRKFLEVTRGRVEGALRVGAFRRALRQTLRRRTDRPDLPGTSDVAYLLGDATALPLAADSVDAVVLAVVLGEVPDRRACLADVARVLRPGGRLSITEQEDDADYVPREEAVSLAEDAGLAHAETFEGSGVVSGNYTVDLRNGRDRT